MARAAAGGRPAAVRARHVGQLPGEHIQPVRARGPRRSAVTRAGRAEWAENVLYQDHVYGSAAIRAWIQSRNPTHLDRPSRWLGCAQGDELDRPVDIGRSKRAVGTCSTKSEPVYEPQNRRSRALASSAEGAQRRLLRPEFEKFSACVG